MPFALQLSAFRNGAEIPAKFTCSGANLSPAIAWSGAPANTRSLALILEDPDAPGGTWTHWLIWNLPVQPATLPEGVPADGELRNGARQGRNDFGRIGYGGPCPPPGRAHRYFFRLFALHEPVDLRAGSGRPELERAMQGHALAQASWMGTYHR